MNLLSQKTKQTNKIKQKQKQNERSFPLLSKSNTRNIFFYWEIWISTEHLATIGGQRGAQLRSQFSNSHNDVSIGNCEMIVSVMTKMKHKEGVARRKTGVSTLGKGGYFSCIKGWFTKLKWRGMNINWDTLLPLRHYPGASRMGCLPHP